MDKVNLFDEFRPISKEEWKQKVVQDLKGKDFEQLIWQTEGLNIAPFYTHEDLTSIPSGHIDMGLGSGRNWTISEKIALDTALRANEQALEALNQGADGIIFQMLDDEVPDLDVLLKNIALESCALYFEGKDQAIVALQNHIDQQKLTAYNLNGGFLYPSIATHKEMELEENPRFRRLFIASGGGDMIQQLVAILQKTAATMDKLTDQGIAPSVILTNLIIKFEMGSSYFKEIAKLRACRILIGALAKAYEIQDFVPSDFHIHTETSVTYSAGEDRYNNMLRNTTQAMSAILGGCDSIYVHPHTDTKEEKVFARRMARNIPLILREEVYFDKVSDPAAGSYYIENLTQCFVEEAWQGFLKATTSKEADK